MPSGLRKEIRQHKLEPARGTPETVLSPAENMLFCFSFLRFLARLPTRVVAVETLSSLADEPTSSPKLTSITLLYENNLNSTNDLNHSPFLLLDNTKISDSASACVFRRVSTAQYDLRRLLFRHSEVSGMFGLPRLPALRLLCWVVFWLSIRRTKHSASKLYLYIPYRCLVVYPNAGESNSKPKQQNIRYIPDEYVCWLEGPEELQIPRDSPRRSGCTFWVLSAIFMAGSDHQATQQSSQCPQYGSGDENCLFLSIYTSFIPKTGSLCLDHSLRIALGNREIRLMLAPTYM